ncbi:hypothetical protein GCM10027213_58070 [Mycobacterium bourgelatii]
MAVKAVTAVSAAAAVMAPTERKERIPARLPMVVRAVPVVSVGMPVLAVRVLSMVLTATPATAGGAVTAARAAWAQRALMEPHPALTAVPAVLAAAVEPVVTAVPQAWVPAVNRAQVGEAVTAAPAAPVVGVLTAPTGLRQDRMAKTGVVAAKAARVATAAAAVRGRLMGPRATWAMVATAVKAAMAAMAPTTPTWWGTARRVVPAGLEASAATAALVVYSEVGFQTA